jgi:O-methyltransferase
MYGSTMDAITNLYPRLSEGGYCIIDDYGGLKDCAKAVEDYRAAHSITDEIHTIDWTGRYWRKGCSAARGTGVLPVNI